MSAAFKQEVIKKVCKLLREHKEYWEIAQMLNIPVHNLVKNRGVFEKSNKEFFEKSRKIKGAQLYNGNPNGKTTAIFDEKLFFEFGQLGLKNAEIARLLGITKEHFEKHLKEKPQLKQEIDRGLEHADAKVIKSIYRRALGFKIRKQKVVTFQGEVTDIYHEDEIFPPDTKAATLWLQNRKGWKIMDQPQSDASDRGSILDAIDKMIENAQ